MSWGVIPSWHSRMFYVPVPITTRWLLYQMATYVVSNKRVLICGLNIDYLLVDLSSYKFGSDFSKKLLTFYLKHYG